MRGGGRLRRCEEAAVALADEWVEVEGIEFYRDTRCKKTEGVLISVIEGIVLKRK
jgi:hypothetical protein